MKKDLEKLKKTPKEPGVYRFLDSEGNILYIGRAINLNNRLKQYFQKNTENRIFEMINTASDFKYETTDTLLEAIILEANLIKKYWPKYNIRDKDDRSFVYLGINRKDKYPKPFIIRGRDLEKFSYNKIDIFGPYKSVYILRQALRVIRRIFPYSTCKADSGKACFDYQIGLCPGACISAIEKKEYKKNIDNIILLLKGEKKRLMKKLLKENPNKAKALENIQEVSLLQQEDSLKTKKLNRIEGYDVSHLSGKETVTSMVVLTNGEIDKSEYRLFNISNANSGDDLRSLEEALTRRLKHKEWGRPDLIMLDGGKPQLEFIYKLFYRNNISIPLVGISKYGGDELVFSRDVKKVQKELVISLKSELLKLREEAHRFSKKASIRRRKLNK